jgi:hypothetical protein
LKRLSSKLSRLSFDIEPRKEAWDASSNTTVKNEVARRIADLYVFAVFLPTKKSEATPLSMTQWEFYVLPTKTLDTELGAQKSLGIRTLSDLAAPVSFQELRGRVDSFLECP